MATERSAASGTPKHSHIWLGTHKAKQWRLGLWQSLVFGRAHRAASATIGRPSPDKEWPKAPHTPPREPSARAPSAAAPP